MHKLTDEFLGILNTYADDKSWCFTGSSIICDPPVLDTDTDVVVIYNGAFSSALQSAGYEITPTAEYPNDNLAACYRKGTFNIIACHGQEVYKQWYKATALAKFMNLKEKHQRLALFQFITEGKVREQEIYY